MRWALFARLKKMVKQEYATDTEREERIMPCRIGSIPQIKQNRLGILSGYISILERWHNELSIFN